MDAAASESPQPAAPAGRSWRVIGVFLAIATGLGCLSSLQLYSIGAAMNRPIPVCDALYWGMRGWFEWLVLLPLVFWVCRRWTFTRSSWARVLGPHVVAAIALPLVHALLSAAVSAVYHLVSGWPLELATTLEPALGRRLQLNFAAYLGIVLAYHVWLTAQRLRQREGQLAQVTHMLTEARLQALQAQLNPHFLFNTLNTVTSLHFTQPEAANRILAKLAHVLRFSLDSAHLPQVTLEREMAFIRHYLDIETTRFGDQLVVEIDAPEDTLSTRVPTLLLHPIVENAVRYATRHGVKPARVRIQARRHGHDLEIEVTDSGPGFSAGWEREPEQGGIGLQTTRDRLRLTPGAGFTIGSAAGGGARVTIRVPQAVGAAVPREPMPV